jgi:hypothetical protein
MHHTGQPERIRTANRLADNEDREVILVGLATDVAGRRCVHLDRDDAIVPVVGAETWGGSEGLAVEARGALRRHAPQNDPDTGLSSLELVAVDITTSEFADDGIVRSMPVLTGSEGGAITIEGMAYRSSKGNIVVLYGGLVYVPDLDRWDARTVGSAVHVRGTVRHGALPPEAPAAGGSWFLDHPSIAPPPQGGPT